MAFLFRAYRLALFVLYPAIVYVALTRFGPRVACLLIAAALVLGLPQKLSGKRREHVLAVLGVPLSLIAVALVGALTSKPWVVMALPALSNVALLMNFAASLRGMPIAERFARAVDDDVTPAQVVYCRTVTVLWCVFFAVNAALIVALAIFAPLAVWAIYSGAVAYALVGVLLGIEYVVRRIRFRKYVSNPFDRFLARFYPPRAQRPAESSQ